MAGFNYLVNFVGEVAGEETYSLFVGKNAGYMKSYLLEEILQCMGHERLKKVCRFEI